MRLLVIGFALLAGLKVWTQDRIVRSAMGDALIEAYHEKALLTCRKQAQRLARLSAGTWSARLDAEITIGDAYVDVAYWDFDNPLWNVRFRHPHLVLTGAEANARCAYDVIAGLANVTAP